MSGQPMEPQFMDPPPVCPGFEEWLPTVEALKANTGKWALIFDTDWDDTAAQTLANRIRARRNVWAGEEWEVTTRSVGPQQKRRSHVYARHISQDQAGGDA